MDYGDRSEDFTMSKEEKPKFHKRRALGIWASTHGKAHYHDTKEAMRVCEYYQSLYSDCISKKGLREKIKAELYDPTEFGKRVLEDDEMKRKIELSNRIDKLVNRFNRLCDKLGYSVEKIED